MKAQHTRHKTYRLLTLLLTGILMMHLQAATAQENGSLINNTNLNVNVPDNINVSSRNLNLSGGIHRTGPNGIGGPNVSGVRFQVPVQKINVLPAAPAKIDMTGPNGRGPNGLPPTEVSINLPKPRIAKAAGSSVQANKPKARPVLSKPKAPAAKHPVVAAKKPAAKVPVPQAAPKKKAVALVPKKPLAKPVAAAAPKQAVVVPPVLPPAPMVETPVAAKAPVVAPAASVPAALFNVIVQNQVAASVAKTFPRATGGGSASKSTSHKSKRHGMRAFTYAANKKLARLFASKHKGKFDPAKCFVWG